MTSSDPITHDAEPTPNWLANANLLWDHRVFLARVTGMAMIVGVAAAFLLPKRYESTARLMPPESGGNSAMLAAVLGRAGESMGSLGGLAGSLLGGRSTGVLFLDLLHSRTIADQLIDRFDLQHLYHKRYRVDTVKRLGERTVVAEDKKSGVISITVTDSDPVRARDIAQGYVDELNKLVVTSNTSSARRERLFIEQRLVTVQKDLESAQKALSEFSSTNTTLDIKEQTRAMVDSAAKLQGELSVGESELGSLEQIYGPENVRVRAARARIGTLQSELNKIGGSSSAQSNSDAAGYPTIRQLPRLAVPYANLYRRVRIEETVFELLSQQYEMARIEEAKDTPAVS
ncbi:MAG: Wzz/FepE/Etk N-terminal domain-containing protein, partial [Acidobacteriota bacterium]